LGHAIDSHLHQLILLPPNGFLQQKLKVDGKLDFVYLFSLSLCLPLKVALFFLLLLINTSFPIEPIILNAPNEENLTENNTTPMVSENYT
jgi:hypothetical protein